LIYKCDILPDVAHEVDVIGSGCFFHLLRPDVGSLADHVASGRNGPFPELQEKS